MNIKELKSTKLYKEYSLEIPYEEIDNEVDNKFNRLVAYPSSLIHAPTDLFGDTMETGRLTLSFFI